MTNLTFTVQPVGTPSGWETQMQNQISTDLTAVRNTADLSFAATAATYTLRWNSGTSSWPSIPSGLPVGTVIRYDSLHDAAATTPPVATAGYQWFRKLS